jgi:hypothetical protein
MVMTKELDSLKSLATARSHRMGSKVLDSLEESSYIADPDGAWIER